MWTNVCAYLSYFLFQHFLIVELQLLPLISSTPALTTVWKRVERKLSIHSLHLFYDGALPRFSSTCERNTKQTGLKNTLMHSFHLQTGKQAHSQCFFLRLVRVLVLMPTLQCVCACVCAAYTFSNSSLADLAVDLQHSILCQTWCLSSLAFNGDVWVLHKQETRSYQCNFHRPVGACYSFGI